MKAYGYCRYSSDMQTEMSIIQQKNELIEYADKNNINIVDFYCDEAKSGTKDNRDNFQAMISDCKKQLVDCILVWKTDRFARNTQDSLFYKMKLEKLGIKIISITQPIDSNTPEGNLMYTLLAGMDEYYSKNLASNVKRALKLNAQNCQFNGGIAPLGYKIVDKHYVIEEEEAKIIRFIFNHYTTGYSMYDIINMLNEKGYRTRKGVPFNKNSIHQILNNEKYTGTYIFNKGNKHNHNIPNNEIRIENGIPAIISKEQFEKVRSTKRNNTGGVMKAKNIYLLSGLLYCGKCGARYFGQTTHKVKNNNTYVSAYYLCSNRNKIGKCDNHRIKKDHIEKLVLNAIYDKILNGQNLESLINSIQIQFNNFKKQDNSDEEIKELNNVNNKINNLVNIISTTGNVVLVKELEKLTSKKEILEEKIEFNKKLTDTKIKSSDIENILKKDINNLKSSSQLELKNLVRKYVHKIVIYQDKFEITFTFDNTIKVLDRVSNEPSLPTLYQTYTFDIKSLIKA